MSQVSIQEFECDRCGASVGNASIQNCLIVSDLDPEREGMIRVLHFCRENGCAGKVLSARNMEHHKEIHGTAG